MAKLALLVSLIALVIALLAYNQVGGMKDISQRIEAARRDAASGLAAARKETAEGLAAMEKALRPADRPAKSKP